MVNHYPCIHKGVISNPNQPCAMQSRDPLFMYINKYPSSIKNSIDIIPLMKKRVQPPRIVLDKESPKDPLPITSKGSKHAYIHFE